MYNFDKKYNEIMNKYQIHEHIINISNQHLIYYKEPSYLSLYKSLITEEYTIFPVPRKLLNDMLDFSLNNKSLNKKIYICQNILENYILDWKYYNQFKTNIKLMLDKNINCSITLILFNNFNSLMQIFKQYKNEEVKNKCITQYDKDKSIPKGIAFDYTNDFDICLAINCSIKDKFELHKTIQHELIHWMQVSLNSETNTTYGKFKPIKMKLNIFERQFLIDLGVDSNYLLSEFEFEPWVANTCEEFSRSGLTIDQYIEIIKDDNLFVDKVNSVKDIGQREMYIFGKICHICSNRKEENYWYYLIEALKEN